MSAVYSVLLWAGTAPSSSETVYTVPAGQTAVITDINYVNPGATGVAFSVVGSAPGFAQTSLWYDSAVESGKTQHVDGRWVLPSGTVVALSASGGATQVWLSGWLLGP